MKKFRLTMWVGNCENFGTEWEELEERVKIVEAESKEEVEEEYHMDIYDCDCKNYYIEELGVPCFKVIYNGKCVGQYEEFEKASKLFDCYLGYFENLEDAVGQIRLEVGIIE